MTCLPAMISSSASSCAGYSSNPASAAQSTNRSRIASGSDVPPGGTRAIRDGRVGWRAGSAMAGGLWHDPTAQRGGSMKTAKEDARRLIESLPDNATWDDVMYEFYVR